MATKSTGTRGKTFAQAKKGVNLGKGYKAAPVGSSGKKGQIDVTNPNGKRGRAFTSFNKPGEKPYTKADRAKTMAGLSEQ